MISSYMMGNKYGKRYNYVSIIEGTKELKLPSPVPNLPVASSSPLYNHNSGGYVQYIEAKR